MAGEGYAAQRQAAARLLAGSGAAYTAADMAERLSVSRSRSSDVLADLVKMGVATRTGRPYRYSFGCTVEDRHGVRLRVKPSSGPTGLWFITDDSDGESLPIGLLERDAVARLVAGLAGWLTATSDDPTDQRFSMRQAWSR